MKKLKNNLCWDDRLLVLEQILTQWWHPVASSEALDLLHWAILAVKYRAIVMSINTARKIGVFLNRCFVCCCPGGCWVNTKQVVAQWRRPVALDIALDMLHWAMHFLSYQRTAMAINMACNGGTFVCHYQFCHRP
jgi:hypothetical protein